MNTSIPVHLYICVLVYQSTCIPVTPKVSVYQSTCIPVTQKSSIPVTKIPVYQSLPSPRYHHLMSAPYESSPLAAVVISMWTTSVPAALV